ncbi:hypothetical protein H2248_002886 [Termitomyces sp. 'cryptogamus']|nr:hypothetical protein H2248_002886 [Termitomyces sp. 'cryptogamus']
MSFSIPLDRLRPGALFLSTVLVCKRHANIHTFFQIFATSPGSPFLPPIHTTQPCPPFPFLLSVHRDQVHIPSNASSTASPRPRFRSSRILSIKCSFCPSSVIGVTPLLIRYHHLTTLFPRSGTVTIAQMYSESVKKRAKGTQDNPPRDNTGGYMNTSPARPTLGRRKQRDTDVSGQQVEQEPRTPTRPRRNPRMQADMEGMSDTETEERMTSKNKAIRDWHTRLQRRSYRNCWWQVRRTMIPTMLIPPAHCRKLLSYNLLSMS